ncbi:hypothetical protein GCM10008090_17440 [Arenicella chitinivorans]|uniref:Peptidase S1 domain-containing protein n=1 Tax=Arenicella chitinivorans TaxID=1329800 RepID=A0A918RR86_9GAMM|nr:hypothetical protein [Arenicella chitinivorans]GHA08118.1 hypothetical protein GCM10008090_17440 [Arenicella chitinivorans]
MRDDTLLKALYAWAIRYAILADVAMRDAVSLAGDPNSIPFTPEQAAYFKTRKIVKIASTSRGKTTVYTIATRLPIARRKREALSATFASAFQGENVLLEVVVLKPFKVDQQVQGTYNPVYLHNDRIACGSSLGLGNQRNAGTLTALARHQETSKLLGISCNHVTGGCNTAGVGTPIVVPGILDVSPDNHEITVIGLHDSTGSMSQGLPQVFDIADNCDIAFFELTDQNLLTSMQGQGADAYDTPSNFARIREGMTVKKWGRSTDLTRGEITRIVNEPESIEYNVVSYYGPTSSQVFKGTVYYPQLYEVESIGVEPFSAGGDSGALVVSDHDDAPKIVGILIGGNTSKSYVLPLRSVLKRHQLDLVGGVNI